MELFFPEAFAAIDWHHPFSFRNNELQQIAPEDQVGQQRADTLVQVRRRDGTPAWIFIHIEVQSQHDSDFPMRMFRYNARLFDRERQPIVSLAVLGDEHPTWEPNNFGYGLWGCTLIPSTRSMPLMLHGTRSRPPHRLHPRSITISDATLDALRAALPANLSELSDAQLRTATTQWLDDTLTHLQEHLVHYLTRQRLNRTAFDAACKKAF